jgi:hypothetical protein
MTGSTDPQAWVLELSGLRVTGGVDLGTTASGPATQQVTTPTVTPTGAPAFIVAAVGSDGTLGSVVAGNRFTGLPSQQGSGGACCIAAVRGTYGPVLQNSSDGWNASIAAFR